MKKFAPIFLSLLLVFSMALTGVMSVSAYELSGKVGNLVIVKQEPDETPDDPADNKPVSGAEFTIFPILELDSDGLYQKTPAFKDTVVLTDLMTSTVNKDGYLTYGDSDELEKQITALQNFALSNAEAIRTSTAKTTGSNGKAIFYNLPYGVYLVVETKVPDSYSKASRTFLVAINADSVDGSNNPDSADGIGSVTAYPKNVKLADVDKNIIDENNNPVKTDSVSIGDSVKYEITADVPTYDTKKLDEYIEKDNNRYQNIPYYFIDVHSAGLTFNGINSVKVVVGRTDMTSVSNISYSTADRKLVVDVPFAQLYNKSANHMGEKVSITYTMTLNEQAKITSGETNHVNYYYVNDISTFYPDLYFKDDHQPDPDKEKVNPDQPAEDPVVYTYEMDLTKLLNSKAYNGKAGEVEFTLSYAKTEGSTFNPVFFTLKDGVYYVSNAVVAASATTSATDVNTAIAVNANGKIIVRGLKAGVYKLTEIKTVNGYTMLTAPVSIFVNEHNVTGTTKIDGIVDAYRYNINSEKVDLQGSKVDGVFELTVNNAKNQFNIPTTGGMGMLIFTIGGAVILAVAVILIVSTRKKKN